MTWQVVLILIMSFWPLAVPALVYFEEAPYKPVSPQSGLTLDLLGGSRTTQFALYLLHETSGGAYASFFTAGLLTLSLLVTYCVETLPLEPMAICQALAASATARKPSWTELALGLLTKLIPWFGLAGVLYLACVCCTSFISWVLFGLVAEPSRFVASVSSFGSFVYTVSIRLYNLTKWRHFLREAASVSPSRLG